MVFVGVKGGRLLLLHVSYFLVEFSVTYDSVDDVCCFCFIILFFFSIRARYISTVPRLFYFTRLSDAFILAQYPSYVTT